jgi:hypothetical protein
VGRGGIKNVGGIQSDFGCHQGWTASRISFFSWWNKENRALILPILLTVVFNIVATPELLVIEDFIQIILSGILFAWLAVRLINAISVRGVAGLADDTVELRLRSLRLVAGWVLILSLGLTLTKTYAGQGTTYAAVWMLFEFLSIPVIVLLLIWWRLEIRKVLLDLPALPGWLQKSAQHSGGLKGYLFTALGGLYLVFIFSR